MEYTYYVGEGPEAKAVIDAANIKVAAYREAVKAFMESLPEGALCWQKDGWNGGIVSFCFPEPFPDAKEFGVKRDVGVIDRIEENGKRYRTYVPDRRCNKGKELRKRMDAVNGKYVSFSREVIDALKIDWWARDGNIYLRTAAGCKDGKLFVRIPGHPGDDNNAGKFPEVPSWFREPSGDEAIFFLM